MSCGVNIFCFFAVLLNREMTAGCYIDFSGFSTSRANLAQECFLNTTCVTAGTLSGTKTKNKQDWIHGADI
jgi:hypothetical protein